jgi:hypothetical protein
MSLFFSFSRVLCSGFAVITLTAAFATTLLVDGLIPQTAQAQTMALDFNGGGPAGTLIARTHGWSFSLAMPIQVTQLGILDFNGDGLAQSHPIGLWNTAGALLTSATVPAGTAALAVPSASGAGSFRFVDISPLLLTPGNYVLGAGYNNEIDRYYNGSTSVTMPSGFIFGTAREFPGPGLVFPSLTNASHSYFGPNLRYTPVSAAAPEPGVAAFMLVGLLPWARRRFCGGRRSLRIDAGRQG